MIEKFKDSEIRDSAVIYKSTFEQIKKLYAKSPEQAGELAIAAFELALTGEISSDNFMIDVILEDMRVINQKNKSAWERKVEAKRQQKITDQKLDIIAALHKQGFKQAQIAERVGTTQQTICNRIALIKTEYPELLQENLQANLQVLQEKQVIQDLQDYVNVNENENVNLGNSCANAQVLLGGSCGKPQAPKKFSF